MTKNDQFGDVKMMCACYLDIIAKDYILIRCFSSKIYISGSKNNYFDAKLHENDIKITTFST